MSSNKENIELESKAVEGPMNQEKESGSEKTKTDAEGRIKSFGEILKKILSGDLLANNAVKRQVGVILLVAFFIVLSTSNRYSCQQANIRYYDLKKELSDAENRALSSFSRLTEKSRRSKLIESMKSMNDSVLQVSTQPPYIVEIPQDHDYEE